MNLIESELKINLSNKPVDGLNLLNLYKVEYTETDMIPNPVALVAAESMDSAFDKLATTLSGIGEIVSIERFDMSDTREPDLEEAVSLNGGNEYISEAENIESVVLFDKYVNEHHMTETGIYTFPIVITNYFDLTKIYKIAYIDKEKNGPRCVISNNQNTVFKYLNNLGISEYDIKKIVACTYGCIYDSTKILISIQDIKKNQKAL